MASMYSSLDGDELPKRSNTLFPTNESNYATLTQNTQGQDNLEDEIEDEAFQSKSIHSNIQVRKRANGSLFPYSTNALHNWVVVHGKATEPTTREDISYLRKRLVAKKRWMQMFPYITVNDMTPDFKDRVLRDWVSMRKEFPTAGDTETVEKARAFVDLATLETYGLLIQTTCKEASEKLRALLGSSCRSYWLIRKSDQHGKGLSNSQIFTVSLIDLYGVVQHVRWIQIDGAGIFRCSLEKSFEDYTKMQSFVCVIDVLQYYISRGHLVDVLYTV